MARVSPVTWLVAVAVALIAAFVGSTILVERNAAQLDHHAIEIVDNATPSITELAAARTEMRRLELGVGRYLGTRMAGTRSDIVRGQVDNWRAGVDAHLAAYGVTPSFDDERALRDALVDAKLRVYSDLDRALALVDTGRTADARAVLLGPLTTHGDELDQVLMHLIACNNEHAASAGRSITALRHRSSLLAILLDAVTVILGVVLVLAAVRAARLYDRALVRERRLAEEHLQLAETRASELDQFAERIAHDLKAPLASVLLGTSVAAEYPSETRRALEKVQRTSRLMSDMIDALLAVARVAPQSAVKPTPVAPIVEILVEEVRPAATAVEAIVELEPIPATAAVACNPGVVASVVSNLLQNAVKYIQGAPGERRVTVRVLHRGPCVRFEVKDTGPGLPPALESHVFERYVRGAGSTGLGLGLATVKHLVETVGGRLGVISTPGKGSCFWVELPRASAQAERAAS